MQLMGMIIMAKLAHGTFWTSSLINERAKWNFIKVVAVHVQTLISGAAGAV